MDADVSWANFKSFVESGSNGTEKWPSTPPDGSVLHASPRKPDDSKVAKYEQPGSDYVLEDIASNGGMLCDDKLESDSEVAGSMMTESSWPVQQLKL